MFGFFRRWRRKRLLARSEIDAGAWEKGISALPLLQRLTADEKKRLIELATIFIYEKNFVPAQGFELDLDKSITIALQACLPILNLGSDWYDNWVSVIIYPDGFAPERIVVDENGVSHRIRDAMAGEAWLQGPVILAWPDVESAGVIDGTNLVIHEFSHKLDMQNGAANGMPPLHRDMKRQDWTQSFSEAYDHFRDRLAKGRQTGIDSYAATDPAEFFAVLSEVFFETPEDIHDIYPDVYRQLSQFYRQDPLTSFATGGDR